MTLNLALLGAGRIGQVHARAIASVDEARLVAIADPVAAAAQNIADKYGCDIRNIDSIIGADDVEGVLICTPTDTHADLIERCAKAGQAIFCEKPVDLSLERVKQCLSVVDETGATLMVGFNRRYDPDFRALRAAIDAGKVGAVEMVTITSRDPGPPPYDYIERSGGIFRDMTIHDFDVARWMLGEEVETVLAAGSVLVDAEIGKRGDYDSVNVILRTASGRLAVITNSRRATYGYDQRIEVHGSKGSASVENHRTSRIEVASESGYTRPPLLDFFMTRYTAAYAAEIVEFVSAVGARRAPETTGHDGLMSLALADAAVLSAKRGRAIPVAEILG